MQSYRFRTKTTELSPSHRSDSDQPEIGASVDPNEFRVEVTVQLEVTGGSSYQYIRLNG